MSEEWFEDEDFNELARIVQSNPGDGRIARACARKIANAVVRRKREEATRVFGLRTKQGVDSYRWFTKKWAGRTGRTTHCARLMFVEEIPK